MTAMGDTRQHAMHAAEAQDTGAAKDAVDTRLGPGQPPESKNPDDQIPLEQESPDLENESSDDEYDKG